MEIRPLDPTFAEALSNSPGMLPTGAILADDSRGQTVILFPGDWALNYFTEKTSSGCTESSSRSTTCPLKPAG